MEFLDEGRGWGHSCQSFNYSYYKYNSCAKPPNITYEQPNLCGEIRAMWGSGVDSYYLLRVWEYLHGQQSMVLSMFVSMSKAIGKCLFTCVATKTEQSYADQARQTPVGWVDMN